MKTVHLDEQIKDWFLEYSSYVILERAVPHLSDGLKPVQRRILHSMYEMEDGRYNKVQTIVGHTAKYHPHGDMAVKDALVTLGQKDYLIDKQGSWGNLLTGDGAAAGRYIEARLTKLAQQNIFNPRLTKYKTNYDGRYQEPEALAVKLPILLLQGTEGIAVGLASSILPHNFNEVMDACIAILRNEAFTLEPDFYSGGKADLSEYNNGSKGRIRIRAKIDVISDTKLHISEVPYSVTTVDLKESIVQATLRNKLRIKEVEDLTTKEVSLYIELPPGESTEKAIAALYAFTKCEITLPANAVVIADNKPAFMTVDSILRANVAAIKELIKNELELEIADISKQQRKLAIEEMFLKERLYRGLEESSTFDKYKEEVSKQFEKHKLPITQDEIDYLVGLPLKRIGKFDIEKFRAAKEVLKEKRDEAERNLAQLTKTTIRHFRELKEKYGKNHPRRTKIEKFTYAETSQIENTFKIYVNMETGFAGTSMKKDTLFHQEVTKVTDLLGVSNKGTAKINRVGEKTYFGEGLLDFRIYDKSSQLTYSLLYQCKESGRVYAKRFQINKGLIRNKEYVLCGNIENKILHFSVQTAKEKPPKLKIRTKSAQRTATKQFDFSTINIKNMNAQGNLVTKHTVLDVE